MPKSKQQKVCSRQGGTAIKSCRCTHSFQDAAYGRQQRVHNIGKTTVKGVQHTCTVCSNARYD